MADPQQPCTLACIAILNAFSNYLRSRPDPFRDPASP
jgi:hypothetical protein